MKSFLQPLRRSHPLKPLLATRKRRQNVSTWRAFFSDNRRHGMTWHYRYQAFCWLGPCPMSARLFRKNDPKGNSSCCSSQWPVSVENAHASRALASPSPGPFGDGMPLSMHENGIRPRGLRRQTLAQWATGCSLSLVWAVDTSRCRRRNYPRPRAIVRLIQVVPNC